MARKTAGKPTKGVAYDKALGLLARREHSTRELKTKLALRGHDKVESVEAIDRLRDQQYQSDDRFAASLARRRGAQGYGPRRIGAELRSHGLNDAAIRAVLAEVDLDWTAIASVQSRKRFGPGVPADSTERAKRADVLLRRGFDPATVRAVTRAEVDDPGQNFD